MIKKVEGLIIDDRNYSESSKILFVITKEYGLISIMAKGVRKIKSKLRGVTGKLTYGYFHVYYKENKLSTLIDVDIINSLKLIKTDLLKISYTSYLCELVGQVIKQVSLDKDKKEIFDVFIGTLLKINEGFDPMVLTNILELKLLDYLGVKPMIDSCVKCGDTKAIITISPEKGGFLCHKCHNEEYIVKDKTIQMIRMFYYVDITKITKLDIDSILKNEINKIIEHYYEIHTGLYLKSKDFLHKINVDKCSVV